MLTTTIIYHFLKWVALTLFLSFSSFFIMVLYINLTELITSARSISSVLDSSIADITPPGPRTLLTDPAWFSRNLKASTIIWRHSFLSSAIVIMAIKLLYRQSWSMKVEPWRLSRSKDIDSNRHMWKKDLYWMLASPGWWRYLQYIKVRIS